MGKRRRGERSDASRRAKLLGALAGLAVAARAGTARAQPAEGSVVDLEWRAPAECPTRDAIVADVARILGPSAKAHPRVSARAEIDRVDASTWKAAVTILTEEGPSRRSFEGASCEALAAAAVLIVAASVGPIPPPVLPASLPVEEHAPGAPPPRGIERPSHLTAAVLPAFDLGSLPSAGAGGLLALGWLGNVGPGHMRLEADAGAWLAQSAALASQPTEGARFSLQTFGARGCYLATFGHADLGPCVGLEVDRLQATGFSTNKALDGVGVSAALRGGLLASWAFSGVLAIRAGVDAVAPFSRPEFVVELPSRSSASLLFRPSPVGARGVFGVEVRFR